MPAGLSDRIDCARLAEEAAVLERSYQLRDLPRLQDILADQAGALSASFAFGKLANGSSGARVHIEATPKLVCQRCLKPVAVALSGQSAVEFAASEAAEPVDEEHDIYLSEAGLVSLQDLAEEELLLALPIAALHESVDCDAAAGAASGARTTRPFAGLQELLKKT
jgi:uncharacterized protein